jgi:hypothetical protein
MRTVKGVGSKAIRTSLNRPRGLGGVRFGLLWLEITPPQGVEGSGDVPTYM